MQDKNSDHGFNWGSSGTSPSRPSRRSAESIPTNVMIAVVIDLLAVFPRGYSIVVDYFGLVSANNPSWLFLTVCWSDMAINGVLVLLMIGVLVGVIRRGRWGLVLSRLLIPATIISMALGIAYWGLVFKEVDAKGPDANIVQENTFLFVGIVGAVDILRCIYLFAYCLAMNEYGRFVKRIESPAAAG